MLFFYHMFYYFKYTKVRMAFLEKKNLHLYEIEISVIENKLWQFP